MNASISALSASDFEAMGEHAFLAVECLEGNVQPMDRGFVEAAAAQADDVQRGEAGAVADDAAKRDHVPLDARYPADHRRAADANELMDRRRAADHGVLADADVPTHHDIVRHNHVVADLAIMRNVDDGHQHAVGANAGHAYAGRRATVDGAMLPHQSARADLAAGWFVLVLHVLRGKAYGAERE
jgi:hypothetical protein